MVENTDNAETLDLKRQKLIELRDKKLMVKLSDHESMGSKRVKSQANIFVP